MKKSFPQKRRANRGGADEAPGRQAFRRYAAGGIEREPRLPVRHGRTFFGAVGIAKALGESIPLSYGAIAALCVGCGVLRGGLRYLEQYGNHYIAFRLLAVLRDRIFTKLRALCPAKLESRQKGSLLTMITADIETLEVFYAHTVSPSASPGLYHWR